MANPLDVSVVVPTYRRPALLAEAVRSALDRQKLAVEVLVLDDDPDGSAEPVVRQLDDARVRYVRRAQPSGGNPAAVREEGWHLATGRYVAFLDDDDRVAKGGYEALAAQLDQFPEASMAFGRIEPFGGEGDQLAHEMAFFLDAAYRARRALWSRSRMYVVSTLLFDSALFVSSACLVRRASLEELGGLDPRTGVVDLTDFCIRATRAHGCAFVDQVVTHYRYDRHSLVHDDRGRERMRRGYEEMQKSYREKRGWLEFMSTKLFARTVLRWI